MIAIKKDENLVANYLSFAIGQEKHVVFADITLFEVSEIAKNKDFDPF